MAIVNWDQFARLPGGQEANFETLCRGIVRLHFGRFGSFRSTSNQPGVEFHLRLDRECALGSPPDWVGWQCRWYKLPSGSPIGRKRKDAVLKAIRITERVLPQLSKWILWTRYPLTAGDQDWFYKISTTMKLELQTAEDAEALLGGPAETLRGTYFGEWVMTPQSLAEGHQLSAATIRARWIPEAHQEVKTERRLHQMLGDASAWHDMKIVAEQLTHAAARISNGAGALVPRLAAPAIALADLALTLSGLLTRATQLLLSGDFETLHESLRSRPALPSWELTSVPRQLRARRAPLAFVATNALADIRLAIGMLAEMEGLIAARLVAVIADAGGGKTQLSAELTSERNTRPAGILLHGRDLSAGQGLDDLAKKVLCQGRPFQSMESLVAALDAAGQRSRRRLPLMIDGLNEAEDPRNWKGALGALDVLLWKYAHVLVVCTLRTGARHPSEDHWRVRNSDGTGDRAFFAEQALPDQVPRLEMEGFGDDTPEAIRRYFRFYKIAPGDADLPVELLSHPLQLRLFCEVTNPTREHEVGIEAMPRSLTALFERYLADASKRVAELAPKMRQYYAQDVRSVLAEMGNQLWLQRTRELNERTLRKAVGDDSRPWADSVVRLLEQEGVILRVEGRTPAQQNLMAVYDALGGYMVADALLSSLGRDGFKEWIKNPENLAAFEGTSEELHPLATDIFQALVGLVPRRFAREHLWPLLEGDLRTSALVSSLRVEGELLDAATVVQLSTLLQSSDGPTGIFNELLRLRSSPSHPLNAHFTDSELRKMTNADRDIRWTEWIRRFYLDNTDLKDFGRRWRDHVNARTPVDLLRAKWTMWYLTTTVHKLRDKATYALYWFGRGDPKALFGLSVSSLSITDPYVPERMLAASYGVAMAIHAALPTGVNSAGALSPFARQLYDAVFKPGAPYSTTHALLREYARRIVQLASLRDKRLFAKEERRLAGPPFRGKRPLQWGEAKVEGDESHFGKSPFGMDFENYTIGRLVPDRHNYDFRHPEYRSVRGQILWRISQLGWSFEKFSAIDKGISRLGDYHRFAEEDARIDRYAKKYSWIAFHEMAGHLYDLGDIEPEPDGRPSGMDIDPSFPAPVPEHKVVTQDLLGSASLSLRQWIDKGPTPNLKRCIQCPDVKGEVGPWVALDGFIEQEDKKRGRRLFCFIRALLVATENADSLALRLSKQDMGGRWLPEKPALATAFAGEFPWCATFPTGGRARLRFVLSEKKKKVRKTRIEYLLDGKLVATAAPGGEGLALLSLLISSDEELPRQEDIDRIQTRRTTTLVEETHQLTRSFDVTLPVVDFALTGSKVDDLPVHTAILAKPLARRLHLVARPQSFDLLTDDGGKATMAVAHRASSFQNSQEFLFIHEDLLRRYLSENKLSLFWVCWGERALSFSLAERRQTVLEKSGPGYKVFSAVTRFR